MREDADLLKRISVLHALLDAEVAGREEEVAAACAGVREEHAGVVAHMAAEAGRAEGVVAELRALLAAAGEGLRESERGRKESAEAVDVYVGLVAQAEERRGVEAVEEAAAAACARERHLEVAAELAAAQAALHHHAEEQAGVVRGLLEELAAARHEGAVAASTSAALMAVREEAGREALRGVAAQVRTLEVEVVRLEDLREEGRLALVGREREAFAEEERLLRELGEAREALAAAREAVVRAGVVAAGEAAALGGEVTRVSARLAEAERGIRASFAEVEALREEVAWAHEQGARLADDLDAAQAEHTTTTAALSLQIRVSGGETQQLREEAARGVAAKGEVLQLRAKVHALQEEQRRRQEELEEEADEFAGLEDREAVLSERNSLLRGREEKEGEVRGLRAANVSLQQEVDQLRSASRSAASASAASAAALRASVALSREELLAFDHQQAELGRVRIVNDHLSRELSLLRAGRPPPAATAAGANPLAPSSAIASSTSPNPTPHLPTSTPPALANGASTSSSGGDGGGGGGASAALEHGLERAAFTKAIHQFKREKQSLMDTLVGVSTDVDQLLADKEALQRCTTTPPPTTTTPAA